MKSPSSTRGVPADVATGWTAMPAAHPAELQPSCGAHGCTDSTQTPLVPAGGPVVLVSHSYAGLVVTAVADGDPDRATALVYLDAGIVDDGQSEWDITTDEIRQSFLGL